MHREERESHRFGFLENTMKFPWTTERIARRLCAVNVAGRVWNVSVVRAHDVCVCWEANELVQFFGEHTRIVHGHPIRCIPDVACIIFVKYTISLSASGPFLCVCVYDNALTARIILDHGGRPRQDLQR